MGLNQRCHILPSALERIHSLTGCIKTSTHIAPHSGCHAIHFFALRLLEHSYLLCPSVEHTLQSLGQRAKVEIALVGVSENRSRCVIARYNHEAAPLATREYIIWCQWHVIGRGIVDAHKRLRHDPRFGLVYRIGIKWHRYSKSHSHQRVLQSCHNWV